MDPAELSFGSLFFLLLVSMLPIPPCNGEERIPVCRSLPVLSVLPLLFCKEKYGNDQRKDLYVKAWSC